MSRTDPGDPERARSRALLAALVFTFLAHGAAMLGMVAFLLPMIPGGGAADDASRVAAIAAHPWRYRAGWLGWQVTALSDVALAVALVRTPWIPRAGAWVAAALTLAAVVPDQLAQALLVTRGVELAREAHARGDLSAFLALEAWTFPLTSAWAAALYTAGALGWAYCFAKGRAWSRALGALTPFMLAVFVAISVGPLLPRAVRPRPELVGAGNAFAFVLLEAWFALVILAVARRVKSPPTPRSAHHPAPE